MALRELEVSVVVDQVQKSCRQLQVLKWLCWANQVALQPALGNVRKLQDHQIA